MALGCLLNGRPSHGRRMAVAWPLRGHCTAVAWPSRGRCMAVVVVSPYPTAADLNHAFAVPYDQRYVN
eukprot:178293-Lingulodinium_polyedra.AAC.1